MPNVQVKIISEILFWFIFIRTLLNSPISFCLFFIFQLLKKYLNRQKDIVEAHQILPGLQQGNFQPFM